jgi:hypothetical protein
MYKGCDFVPQKPHHTEPNLTAPCPTIPDRCDCFIAVGMFCSWIAAIK